MTLDDILPDPHFRERHSRHIAAPPDVVWTVLQALELRDLPLTRALMTLRFAGRRRPTGRVRAHGPVPVLAEEPPHSLVAGGPLQPWRLRSSRPPALDADALRAFAEPGWVKTGVDFVLRPEAGGTRLTTETRVVATDHRTRVKFGFYWLVIRAGSGLIRRDLLRAVARRAETSGGGPTPPEVA